MWRAAKTQGILAGTKPHVSMETILSEAVSTESGTLVGLDPGSKLRHVAHCGLSEETTMTSRISTVLSNYVWAATNPNSQGNEMLWRLKNKMSKRGVKEIALTLQYGSWYNAETLFTPWVLAGNSLSFSVPPPSM